MGRAPDFWTDERIALVREHFVAAAVPTELQRAKTPEGEFLRAAGVEKHWVTSSGYMTCVSPSGKLLGREPSRDVLERFWELPESERLPGQVSMPELQPGEHTIPAPPEGGLVLRVFGRFLTADEGRLRPAVATDFPLRQGEVGFILEPNTEYLWLKREEWQALVPANPVAGQEFPISARIVDRIARFHLSPRRALTSENGIVPKSEIKQAEMTLTVDGIDKERITLSLQGFVHWGSDFDAALATSPNGPLPFGFETPLHGRLEYDRAKQALVRFDVVAPGMVWGRWGDANGDSLFVERPGKTPIGFAFELAGDGPADRLPPAGNGVRALEAGYFSNE